MRTKLGLLSLSGFTYTPLTAGRLQNDWQPCISIKAEVPQLPTIPTASVIDSPGSGSGQRQLGPFKDMPRLRDKFDRAITDLRVSVTDRCNYKCVYCRTGNEGAQYTELPIAAYLRMTRLFVSLGVEKVRLTGGEPLLRSGLIDMVRELASMRTSWLHDGTFIGDTPWKGQPLDIALTTNGHLLEDLAQPL